MDLSIRKRDVFIQTFIMMLQGRSVTSWGISRRRESNMSSLAAMLPTEILAHIFRLCKGPETQAVKAISHTCHRWRQISVDIPELWDPTSHSSFLYSNWAELCLRRCDPLIDLDFTSYDKSTSIIPALCVALGDHTSRVRSFKAALPQTSLSLVCRLLRKPAPNLERVSIVYERESFECPAAYKIPSSIFEGGAPKLQEFHLVNCYADLRLPVYRNLRKLTMKGQAKLAFPMTDDWLKVLNQMPGLTHASLAISSRPRAPAAPNVGKARLSNLVSFELHTDRLQNGVFLLSRMLLQPTCTLRLVYYVDDISADGEKVADVTHDLRRTISSLRCDLDSYRVHFKVAPWSKPTEQFKSGSGGVADSSVHLTILYPQKTSQPAEVAVHAVEPLFMTLVNTDTRHLKLDIAPEVFEQLKNRMLSRLFTLKKAQHISLAGPTAAHLAVYGLPLARTYMREC
ncbi:hypothetical protein BDQ17DRAFT_1374142 [Cyathus striatus]|nr:hypothetical protein BDQ17DRAFT_1374142 [Cyathus striatus]